jgi:DNA-directed RNA polymerase specialized sigma24 family protein
MADRLQRYWALGVPNLEMDRESYGQAYQEGVERTIRFLLSRGVAREMAPDIAQSAWLRGWERLSQLRDERMVVTWVNTIALNHYRRVIRTERLHQPIDEPLQSTTSPNLAAIDVSRILHVCRPPDRALLEAQMVGVTAKEMARVQGVSETAIRIRFLRARRSARMAVEGIGKHARNALLAGKQTAA